jgi:hypothetical protein
MSGSTIVALRLDARDDRAIYVRWHKAQGEMPGCPDGVMDEPLRGMA